MVGLSTQRRRHGFTLVEMLVVIVIIGVLASLLLPIIGSAIRQTKVVACQNNLGQLYKLGTIYATSHKGSWPSGKGEDLWLSLRRMVPPLIATEHAAVLHCRVTAAEDELSVDETNYRGPLVSFGKLKEVAPLAADKDGNHGEQYGGNVLYKDGRVEEHPLDSEKWIDLATTLSP